MATYSDVPARTNDDGTMTGAMRVYHEDAPSARKRMDTKGLFRKLGWDEADLQSATLSYGFPAGDTRPKFCDWGVTLTWYEDIVDTWIDKQRADIAGREKLIRNLK